MKNPMRLFAAMLIASAIISTSSDASSQELGDFRQWIVTRMASWAPPGRSFIAGAKETKEDGLKRYGDIADAVITVAFDQSERPLFHGRYGRVRTAAALVSIALYESAFRKDVDLDIGPHARGDGGRSWCMAQIQLGRISKGRTPYRVLLTKGGYKILKDSSEGLGGEDLVSDRRNCFRVALRMAVASFQICRHLPPLERLSVYTSGNCDQGRDTSRIRIGKAVEWMKYYPPPMDDAAILRLLNPPPGPVPSRIRPPVGLPEKDPLVLL